MTHAKTKAPLKFTIEGHEHETLDQYKTGAELKEIAGIPLDVALYIKVEKGYEPEIIANDDKIDLARKGHEEFFVKDKFKFTINGDEFVSYQQYLTGKEIRNLGKIDESENLFLKGGNPHDNEPIEDIDEINLAKPGKEHFISAKFSVVLIVNARPKTWEKRQISFEEVVILAFGNYDPNPNRVYTVSYSNGPRPKPEGTMVRGEIVNVKNKMNFDVSATDRS